MAWAGTSCGQSFESRLSDYNSILSEETRCESSSLYSDGITIVGSATFEKRSIEVATENVAVPGTPPTNLVKLKNMSLTDPLPTALPIRFAEISVYDADNKKIQCGITDDTGAIKATDLISDLKIPNINGNYKLRVVSRSFVVHNSDPADFTYISIKQDKYRNELHSLTTSFNLSGASSVSVSLVAHARQTDSITVEAGAFNIMNSTQTAFQYIKDNTVGINTKCLANKLNVFWKAGFNPMQYQSPNADPQTLGNTSFYLPTTKELYISGGQIGDMSLVNTDHFDDFAIIHELGHFVEDHCGQWVSPGGNHTLITRIDPRLAWSEGWANYFAAAVLNAKINDLDSSLLTKFSALSENNPNNYGWIYFFNSYGFSDSVQNVGNGDGFVIDLKRSGTDPGSYLFAPYTGQEFDKVSPTSYPGEGHTREGAITRGLFKLTTVCGSNCAGNAVSFENIWKAFDRITGVAVDNIPYSGSDKFLEKLVNVPGIGSFATGSPTRNAVIENDALHLSTHSLFTAVDGVDMLSYKVWPGYAHKLALGSCNLKIQGRSDGALNGSSSDQRYSNQFFTVDPSTLSGLTQISVVFTKKGGSSVDHDLILFKPGYYFNDDYVCNNIVNGSCNSFSPYRNSTNEGVFVMNRAPSSTLTSYTKNISLTGIDTSQKYLLDIRTWTAGITLSSATEYSYVINSNLGALCPQ